jgi:hypothetical protein
MESRSGIIAVLLLVLGGCSGEDSDSLFGSPGDSGAAGDDSGNGGASATGGKAGGGAGRSGSSGSSGSSAGTGQAGSGTGGSAQGGTGNAGTDAGGSAHGGEESGEAGSDAGGSGAGGSGTAGSGAAGAGGSGVGGSGASGAGGSNPTGGRGGMAGTGGKVSCEELSANYAELLEKAKACDANLDDDQCREQVPSDLGCGCPTSVNPKNDEAMAELQRILLEASKSCPVVICPAIACVQTQGFCTSSGRGNGTCDDGLLSE